MAGVVIEINGVRKSLYWAYGIFGRRLKVARKGTPYVYAEVGVVHSYECPATKTGKSHSACACGGDAMLRKVLT